MKCTLLNHYCFLSRNTISMVMVLLLLNKYEVTRLLSHNHQTLSIKEELKINQPYTKVVRMQNAQFISDNHKIYPFFSSPENHTP